jgi:hypothetical protein
MIGHQMDPAPSSVRSTSTRRSIRQVMLAEPVL